MLAKPALVLSFPGAPPTLKSDLERQASTLDNFFRDLSRNYQQRWGYLPIVAADTFAEFEMVRRIAPRTGDTVIVQLPPAKKVDGGRELRVQRMNNEGQIYFVPPNALINGAARYHMLSSIGFVTVQWDGTGYFTESPGAAP